uniref:Peptidase S1 domain-containing protein n=1 Tax=Cyprinodon variegatus TaxID=28743 RepID=A0A3Q2CED8_CYPVA
MTLLIFTILMCVVGAQIVGSQDATPQHWPWQASLWQGGSSFCGGSLITDQWVLTGAGCVRSGISTIEVHLGFHGLSSLNSNKVIRGIDGFICHPAYNSMLENDMCLLKLSSRVRITDYIQPVCLASGASTFLNGTTSWVTGFGDFETHVSSTGKRSRRTTGGVQWVYVGARWIGEFQG